MLRLAGELGLINKWGQVGEDIASRTRRRQEKVASPEARYRTYHLGIFLYGRVEQPFRAGLDDYCSLADGLQDEGELPQKKRPNRCVRKVELGSLQKQEDTGE